VRPAVGRKSKVKANRAARELVRNREQVAKLMAGGLPDRPIRVPSSSVIEIRIRSHPCPQCEGELRIEEHRSSGNGLRDVAVRCRQCGVARVLWFQIVEDLPN
jgi:hypothetical protein